MAEHDQKTDERISIRPLDKAVTVSFYSAIVASSQRALVLSEKGYDDVVYIPRSDVYTEHMTRTDHRTTCPYKGEASYYRITAAGEVADNVAWVYEDPKTHVRQIAGHLAFDRDKVDITTE